MDKIWRSKNPYLKSITRVIVGISATLLFLTTLGAITQLKLAFAQSETTDFAVNGILEIFFENPSDFVTVRESVTIKVNSSDYFLPSGSKQTFEIPDFTFKNDDSEREFKKDSIKVTEKSGNELKYTVIDNHDRIIVETTQPTDINPGQSYTFVMEYKTRELLERNGNIINLFAPGLPKDFDFWTKDKSGLTTGHSYDGRFKITGELSDISYLQPESLKPKITEKEITIPIPTAQRIGKAAWVQLGTEQFYYFKVVQNTPKTDHLTPTNLGKITEYLSTNIYEIPLPREDEENNQRVYIQKITPEPVNITRDAQGNLTAIFEMPANKDSKIEIIGYIAMSNDGSPAVDMGIQSYFESLKNGSLRNYEEYTKHDKYWESDASAIKDQAIVNASKATTILQLVRENYDFVINHLDYSYDKLESNSNVRSGALAAYNGVDSVCMEYSDLMIALLRAQGVPARAVVGFGNDPTGSENNIRAGELLKQEIGHQWVQVWIPEYGWYSVDPTWGESGRTYLGANLDHILWLTMKSSEDEALSGTSLRSADSIINSNFSAYDVYLKALSKEEYQFVESSTELVELTNYLNRYEDIEYNEISYILKGTLVGRALIIAVPIVLLITLLSVVSVITSIIVRRKNRRNDTKG
jgi:transglutaminase-like putative cysteine protease